MKTLRRIRNVNYNHLDVKASQWHENIARYRQNVKELTISLKMSKDLTFNDHS